MPAFKLIHAVELDEFTAALKRYGWQEEDLSVAEEEYDPATAEIEAATGEVIITYTLAHRVGVYYLGRGSYWVTDFVDDLRAGKFGTPAREPGT